MKEIFSTTDGAIYLFSIRDGWTKKTSKEKISNLLYIGSIDTDKNPAFSLGPEIFEYNLIKKQLKESYIPGFVPEFKLNYAPLGFIGYEPGDFYYLHGGIYPTKHAANKPDSIDVGYPIDKIFLEKKK